MMSGRVGMPSPWLLLGPMLIIVFAAVGYPILMTLWLAFTDTRLMAGPGAAHFIGLENFAFAFSDSEFLAAAGRTIYFTVVSISAEALLGIAVALLLNEKFRGRTFCRALLVLPWAVPTIVNALMWRLIYQPDFGVLNAVLTQSGLMESYRSWLGSEGSAMNAVIVADVWKNYPLVALIVLAALQSAPLELYGAATLDGANAWQRFKAVTWPVIAPPLLVALVLRSIEALKVFDIFYVMTRGGPASSTKTMSFFVYEESFRFMRVGSGASYALIVVLICMVFVGFYVRLMRRQEA
ncbi:MAG: sugar ABC transporter permease [Labrys sp. (in: a-proteobacteria)]